MREVIGVCNYCKLPIPSKTLNGTVAREGIEYKRVFGDVNVIWHMGYPDYPDCFHAEGNDATSVWYDDPWRHIEREEIPEDMLLHHPMYESLD